MVLNNSSEHSPLAQQLDALVRAGLVRLDPTPINDFPRAYVVLPVYDSGNTSELTQPGINPTHAQLARHP